MTKHGGQVQVMVAEALPETHQHVPFRVVQILPNHHTRLAQVARDFGPIVDGSYLFPAYMFIAEKPPAFFWNYTGVVRCLKSEVAPVELDLAERAYHSLRRQYSEQRILGKLQSAVVSVHSTDGVCIATVELFGRNLKVRVTAAA